MKARILVIFTITALAACSAELQMLDTSDVTYPDMEESDDTAVDNPANDVEGVEFEELLVVLPDAESARADLETGGLVLSASQPFELLLVDWNSEEPVEWTVKADGQTVALKPDFVALPAHSAAVTFPRPATQVEFSTTDFEHITFFKAVAASQPHSSDR